MAIKKADNQKVEKPHPFKKGDVVMNDHGEFFILGKSNKEGIAMYHYEDGIKPGHGYGTLRWNELEGGGRHDYIKVEKTPKEIEDEAFANVRDLIDKEYSEEDEEQEGSDSTDVVAVHGNSKEILLSTKRALEEKQKQIEIFRRMMKRKQNELSNLVYHYQKKVEKIVKVLGVFHVYLGVNEDILQIQSGDNAPVEDLITFRQLVLYMDEEIGSSENQGLDYKELHKFDEWLLHEKNYLKLAPESKCVVAIKPRRYDKEYGDPFSNMLNAYNHKTYFLIRNGENLYNIVSEMEISEDIFFPDHTEMTKLYDLLEGRAPEDPYANDFFKKRRDPDSRTIKELLFQYKKRVIFMQGLIERTTIFGDNRDINLLKTGTFEHKIRFIYDATMTLPTGRLPWKEWVKENNNKIRLGTRIVFSGARDYGRTNKEMASELFPYNYRNCWDFPAPGIYNVDAIEINGSRYKNGVYITTKKEWEKHKDEEIESKKFVCHFKPGDKIFDWYTCKEHDRKNSIPFFLWRGDDTLINFDTATSEDFEYYLNNRIDRQNYLRMMPMLKELKRVKKEEEIWENNFIEFLKGKFVMNKTITESSDKIVELIKEAIIWWKFKVVSVRALKKEDAKALRMIESHVSYRIWELSKEKKDATKN